jgi:hypothetical protein
MEPGARSTELLVLTKLPEIFEDEVRPMVAPTPPAINAITNAEIIKNELLCLGCELEKAVVVAGRHQGVSEGAGNWLLI